MAEWWFAAGFDSRSDDDARLFAGQSWAKWIRGQTSFPCLDVFFPARFWRRQRDFGDMPFSQVIKIALAYMSCFILLYTFWPSRLQNFWANEDDSLVTHPQRGLSNNAFVGINSTRRFSARKERYWARFQPAPHSTFSLHAELPARKKIIISSSSSSKHATPMNISAVHDHAARMEILPVRRCEFLSSLANCVVPTSMLIIRLPSFRQPAHRRAQKAHLCFITLLRCLSCRSSRR